MAHSNETGSYASLLWWKQKKKSEKTKKGKREKRGTEDTPLFCADTHTSVKALQCLYRADRVFAFVMNPVVAPLNIHTQMEGERWVNDKINYSSPNRS